MNAIITVIIPLYNEEKNIEKCIKILKNQNIQSFNVCFIDDGSIDRTYELLITKLNENVKFNYEVVQQENKGAAAARETGIEKANTQYIMFLDCDDEISANAIEEFLYCYDKYPDADIYMPDLVIENDNQSLNQFKFFSDEKVLDGKKCFENVLQGWGVHGYSIYKKNVLHDCYKLYYSYNKNHINYINNDEYITRLAFLYSNKVVRVNYSYTYCNNINSTTKGFNPNLFKVINNAFIFSKIIDKSYKPSFDISLINGMSSLLSYYMKYEKHIANKHDWLTAILSVLKSIEVKNIIAKNPKMVLKYYYCYNKTVGLSVFNKFKMNKVLG